MVTDPTPNAEPTRANWAGRILTILIAVLLIFSGVMKTIGGAAMEESIEPLGLPVSMMLPLGILEILCAILFVVPQTAVVGAILLTGYLGGAIATHWRVDDLLFLIPPAIIAILVWLAMALRDPRLWALIPWRKLP